MAGPQILNLDYEFILRKPGETISIDRNKDAVILVGDYPFSTLDFFFDDSLQTDLLYVHTEVGEVEFPDGCEAGEKIVVAGVEIGSVLYAASYLISFEFNGNAT